MIRNVNVNIVDPRTGSALLDPGEPTNKDLTIGSALLNALLMVNNTETPQPSASEKKKRYDLALRIVAATEEGRGGVIDLHDDDLTRIKNVSDLYGTLVYGAIISWAETDYTESA